MTGEVPRTTDPVKALIQIANDRLDDLDADDHSSIESIEAYGWLVLADMAMSLRALVDGGARRTTEERTQR